MKREDFDSIKIKIPKVKETTERRYSDSANFARDESEEDDIFGR